MTDVTVCEELAKNRAYLLKMGNIEISALKLEGYKASQLGGTISPLNMGVEKSNVEGDDWLLIVKDENKKVLPYGVWVAQVAKEVSKVSGSNIGTVSVLTSGDTKVVSAKVDEKKE